MMITIPPLLYDIAKNQPYPLLFATVSGSHIYGFPSRDSDWDLRGVHILPLQEVVGLNLGQETIETNSHQGTIELDLDLVTHDVKKFFTLLLKKNGYVLEQLYSPLVVHSTPEHQELKEIAVNCITKYHCYHYLGFAETQWRLLENSPHPHIKPLLYVYRVLLTGIYLMQTGKIETNLSILNEGFALPYIPDLIACKISGVEHSPLQTSEIEFHQQEYHKLRRTLELASQASSLPEQPSANAALHNLLIRLRLQQFETR